MLWSEDIVVGECIVFQIIMRYKHMTWSPPLFLRLEAVSLSTSRRVIKMDNFLISRSVTFTHWHREIDILWFIRYRAVSLAVTLFFVFFKIMSNKRLTIQWLVGSASAAP